MSYYVSSHYLYIYTYRTVSISVAQNLIREYDTTLAHIPTSVIFIISTMCYGRGDIIRKIFPIIAIELAKA